MKVLVRYEKIIPVVSEIDLDEEKVIEDFGSVQNFIDFVMVRKSLSNMSLIKGTNDDLTKNLENYRDKNFDELNYIKENGETIKTVKGKNEDEFVELEINNFQNEVDEYRTNVKNQETTEEIEQNYVNDMFRIKTLDFD